MFVDIKDSKLYKCVAQGFEHDSRFNIDAAYQYRQAFNNIDRVVTQQVNKICIELLATIDNASCNGTFYCSYTIPISFHRSVVECVRAYLISKGYAVVVFTDNYYYILKVTWFHLGGASND